jgi:hypothetical protein
MKDHCKSFISYFINLSLKKERFSKIKNEKHVEWFLKVVVQNKKKWDCSSKFEKK